MKKDRLNLPTALLLPNLGQLEWLPKNPRQWTQDDIDRTAKSIREDEDFLEDRPLLVTPQGKKWIIFAGNLRRTAAAQAGVKTLPCVVYLPETDEDYDTIKRRAMKDNGSFGSWDYDTLANDWGDLPLTDWGVPVWDADKEDWEKDGLSSKGREGAEGYDEFLDKFKPKLTTDDCYTPPEVFDIVLDFIDTKIGKIDRDKIIRPFKPGGDFEKEDYTGRIVVDNPPFSIYAKVVRFYEERKIPFFLFAPALTALVQGADVTYILPAAAVEYENGAVVSTSFVTNMVGGGRSLLDGDNAPSGHRESAEARHPGPRQLRLPALRLDGGTTSKDSQRR